MNKPDICYTLVKEIYDPLTIETGPITEPTPISKSVAAFALAMEKELSSKNGQSATWKAAMKIATEIKKKQMQECGVTEEDCYLDFEDTICPQEH